MQPRPVSVVVPTRNRPELLDGCLVSLRGSLRDIDELIVVDSASSDARVREVAEKHGAICVRCDVPGASRARNRGWIMATHEIVAFIDDDVRVEPAWASAIGQAFADQTTAFVTGFINEAHESQVPALAQKTDTAPAVLDEATEGVLGHSANLIVRRSALEKIGGFDELLGAGGRFKAAEDLDLFDRLIGAGYTGRYEPSVAASHVQWRRLRDYVRVQGAYGVGSGARIAKLLRVDRAHARRAARSSFIDSGFTLLRYALRDRWWAGVAARSLRLLGTAAGLVLGIAHPVRSGHYGRLPQHPSASGS